MVKHFEEIKMKNVEKVNLDCLLRLRLESALNQ